MDHIEDEHHLRTAAVHEECRRLDELEHGDVEPAPATDAEFPWDREDPVVLDGFDELAAGLHRAALDALEAAGVEVVRYEGADHGFAHDPSRPAHRAGDAADAWRRAIAHLAAG